MSEKIKTLMVYDEDKPSEELGKVLKSLGIEVLRVRSCREALRLLKEANSGEMVFTDTILPDGTWEDILRIAHQASTLLPVIIVSRTADIGLYLETLDLGAFDFVTPPFLSIDIANITGAAMVQKLESRNIRSAHAA